MYVRFAIGNAVIPTKLVISRIYIYTVNFETYNIWLGILNKVLLIFAWVSFQICTYWRSSLSKLHIGHYLVEVREPQNEEKIIRKCEVWDSLQNMFSLLAYIQFIELVHTVSSDSPITCSTDKSRPHLSEKFPRGTTLTSNLLLYLAIRSENVVNSSFLIASSSSRSVRAVLSFRLSKRSPLNSSCTALNSAFIFSLAVKRILKSSWK